jgi:hypothetical protein
MLKRLLSNRSVWFSAILLLGVVGVGFFPFAGSDRWPEPDAKMNPDFVQNPPLATSISLEILDQAMPSGANVILSATFDDATRKRIGGKYLAMAMGGNAGDSQKGALDYLRDDGYDGDEKPGDGRYTKSFQESDVAGLVSQLEKLAATATQPQNAITFVNRHIEPNKKLKNLLVTTTTKKGKVITIDPALLKLNFPVDQHLVEHSLMITNLCVVENPDYTYNPCTNYGNPNGIWTFGELMRQQASTSPSSIASDAQTVDFILYWLSTWNKDIIVNGELVKARPTWQIVQTWQQLSDANGGGGQLLLQNCPFRLMAIVNRVDLRGNGGYQLSNAGEARMVFCLLNANCGAEKFTTIFEYGINKEGCEQVQAWAELWANLSGIKHCDPSYSAALAEITTQFIMCGTNTKNINESSLNQLRSDEIALGFSPWELREWHNTGVMTPVTVKQTPAVIYNAKQNNPDVQLLASWVNANSPSILTNTHIVPDDIMGTPFLGGKSHTESPPQGTPAPGFPPIPHHWDGDPNPGPAQIIDNDTRHVFSLNTCDGCHGGEAQTGFTHIDPTGFGSVATLSGFLTGDVSGPFGAPFLVPDAAGRPAYGSEDIRGFNDLARRAFDLQNLLDNGCGKKIMNVLEFLSFQPLNAQD